jgi:hypothetical protein
VLRNAAQSDEVVLHISPQVVLARSLQEFSTISELGAFE